MKISACWIAKNEENNIARSIESLKDVCDEMIVVDTGSSDGTKSAAEQAGASVEFFEWINDFSAAKNYALSKTSGDIVIFLDADEWFSPSLKKEDRHEIERFFKKNPKVHLAQLKIHNLNSQGNVKTVSAVDRIIRKADGIAFYKPVHEVLLLKNGGAPNSVITDKWPVFHSGYTEDVMPLKMARNIELLEHVAKTAGSPEERHMQHCYLVREYFNTGKLEDCAKHLRAALDEPDILIKQIKRYQVGFVPLLYCMLVAGSQIRDKVSRLELYHKIVIPFKKHLEHYKGTATIELYYNALFDSKEDFLLEGLNGALQKSLRLPETPVLYYKDAEAALNIRAAEASLRRGKNSQAMDYIIAAIKETQAQHPQALKVLLRCLKGQASHDVIAFLNSQFDIKNAHVLNQLASCTRADGFQEVYAYYLNKKIEAEAATKSEYLSLLLLYGKDIEAINAAVDFYMEEDKGLAVTYIFLSAVCSKNESIYLGHKELLKPVEGIMEAYFSGGRLETITKTEAAILLENFDNIAFLAGFERACDFLRVFSASLVLTFQIKARYCVKSGMYTPPTEDILPNPDDYLSNRYLIECLTMRNRCGEAVNRIEYMLGKGHSDYHMLQHALAIYDRNGDPKAKSLYDAYRPALDRLTDLKDIINTGYVPPEYKEGKAKIPAVSISGLAEAEEQVKTIIKK